MKKKHKIFRKYPLLNRYKNNFLQKILLISLKFRFFLYFQFENNHNFKKKPVFYLINRITVKQVNFHKNSFFFERLYRLIILLSFFFKKLYNVFKKLEKNGLEKKILNFSDHCEKKKKYYKKLFTAIISIEILKKSNKKNLLNYSNNSKDKMDFSFHINLILKGVSKIFLIKKHWILNWFKNLLLINNRLNKSKDCDFKKTLENKYNLYFRNFPFRKLDKKIFFSKNLPLNINSIKKLQNFEIESKSKITAKRHTCFLFKNISKFFQDKKQYYYRILPKKFFLTNKKTDLIFFNFEILGIIYCTNIFYGIIGLKKKILLKFNKFQPMHGGPVLHTISYMSIYMFSKVLHKMYEQSINTIHFLVFSFTNDLNLFKILKSMIFSQLISFSNWFGFSKKTCVEIFINGIENILPIKIFENLTKKNFSKKYYKIRTEIKLKIKLIFFFFIYSGTLLSMFNQNLFIGLNPIKFITIFDNLKKNTILASKIKLLIRLAPMIFGSLSIGLQEKKDFFIISLRKIKNKNIRHILLFTSKILSLVDKNPKKVWGKFFTALIEFGKKKIDKTIKRKYYKCMYCFKETIEEIALNINYSHYYLYYEEEKTDKKKNIIFMETDTDYKIEVEIDLKTDYLDNLLTGLNFFSIKRISNKIQLFSIFKFLLFNAVLNYNKSIISSLAFSEVFVAFPENIDILYRTGKKIQSLVTHLFSTTMIGLGSCNSRLHFLHKYIVDFIFCKKTVFIKPIRFCSFKFGDFFSESIWQKIDDLNNNFLNYTKIKKLRIKNNDILYIRLSQGLLFLNITKSFRYLEENGKKINYKNFGIFVNGAYLFIAKNLGGIGNFPISVFLLCLVFKKKRKDFCKKINPKTFKLKNK